MTILATYATILAIGAGYVLTPVALSVFAEFKRPRELTCPDGGNPAQVTVDARYAAMTSAVGATKLRVSGCSRWPGQGGCNRACLSQVTH